MVSFCPATVPRHGCERQGIHNPPPTGESNNCFSCDNTCYQSKRSQTTMVKTCTLPYHRGRVCIPHNLALSQFGTLKLGIWPDISWFRIFLPFPARRTGGYPQNRPGWVNWGGSRQLGKSQNGRAWAGIIWLFRKWTRNDPRIRVTRPVGRPTRPIYEVSTETLIFWPFMSSQKSLTSLRRSLISFNIVRISVNWCSVILSPFQKHTQNRSRVKGWMRHSGNEFGALFAGVATWSWWLCQSTAIKYAVISVILLI